MNVRYRCIRDCLNKLSPVELDEYQHDIVASIMRAKRDAVGLSLTQLVSSQLKEYIEVLRAQRVLYRNQESAPIAGNSDEHID